MKKKRLLTVVKYMAGLIAVSFIALFIWANWNPVTPAQKLKPKAFALFDMSKVTDNNVLAQVNTKMQETQGIAATSIRVTDKLLSVVYYTDVLSQGDILGMLTQMTNSTITQREIKATGPTCPVAGLMGSFSMLKRSLCIRN